MNKMIIIDGNSLLFRAYYATAYPGATIMRTKEGVPTNAIFAFSNMMVKIIAELKGNEHIFVAFDTGKKTFRHEALDSYKAQRKPAPEDLVVQFPLARELLTSLGIFTYEMDGYEGDDLAGTMATKAAQAGYEVIIYTSDRDFLQLANDKVSIHILKKGLSDVAIMTPDDIMTEYGFSPVQMVDYKGLCGDSSDNLPGIPGIGDKTAVKLIQTYGTLENILAHIDELKGKMAENLTTFKEVGLKSKELAKILTDVPVPFSIEETQYRGFDFNVLSRFASRYELRQLVSKLADRHRMISEPQDVVKINRVSSLANVNIKDVIGISLDMEEGNYHQPTIYGLALTSGKQTFYLSFDDVKKDEIAKSILANPSIGKYTYDYKAIKVALASEGMMLDGLAFDILLAAYLLDSNLKNTPDIIFGYFDVLLTKNEQNDLLSNDQSQYHGEISFHALHAAEKILGKIKEIDSLSLYQTIELPLADVLANMEIEGFPLDQKKLLDIGENFRQKLAKISEEIYALAGYQFNIASPSQVAKLLYDDLGLPANKKRSTSVDQLKYLSHQHPLVDMILEHRKYAKLISTYIDGLISYIFPDGKLHASFNQALTTTGRLSSTAPNLQNISIRDEEGKLIRQAFYYPDDIHEILSFDYSQIELRILASLAECKPLIEVFNHKEDIHTTTAQKVFHISGPVNELQRRKAKAVNFGIVYGISDWGLSEQLDIPPSEAKQIINAFYEAYPEIRTFIKSIITKVEQDGYVTTLLGRRRYLREIHDANYQVREFAKRAAMNAPIQGTAADLIKLAMIQIDQALKKAKLQTKMVLQIHDELLFKVPKDEKEIVFPLIQSIMENAIQLDVSLDVNGSYGKTWYDAK